MSRAPARRMTRSQSREVEPPSYQVEVAVKGSKINGGRGKARATPLSTLAEETPVPSSRRDSSVIPESPENPADSTNISGTTFLGHRDDATSDEEESDSLVLTAEDILDDLPDLKSAATMMMNLLVSDHEDERGIVNEARRLRTADRAEKRRVEKHSSRLVDRMSNFTNQIFIDVNHVQNLVPPLTTEDSSEQWSPSPALFSANCARLAHSLLLSTGEAKFDKQVIKTLNFQFPAPFLDRLTSGTEKVTFDLALDIRTQHFVMEFERQQGEKDFHPKTLVQSIFYDASLHEGTELDSRWLRGFNLQSVFLDENMCLPERFHNDVLERIDDITDSMIDNDDTPSITELKAAFPWKRFYRRAAHFLRRRDIEISQDLKIEVDIGDVRRSLRKQLGSQHGTPSSVQRSENVHSKRQSGSNLIDRDERVTQTPSAQQTPTRQPSTMTGSTRPSATQKSSVSAKPSVVLPAPSPARAPAPAAAPVTDTAPAATPVPPASLPNSAQSQVSTTKGPKKKLGHSFLNGADMNRLKKRQQRLSLRAVPEPSQSASMNHENPAGHSFGDETLVNDDYGDFGISNDGEMDLGDFEESTTPPGSARTTQVSHNFGSSSNSPVRRNQPTNPPRSQNHQTPHRFTDRQNNASRVSPINEAESQSAERQTARSNPNLSTKKRTHEEMASDDSEDFEQDDRDIDVEARRAAKPDQSRRVRPRPEQDSDDEDEDEDAINDQLREGLEASSQPAPSQPEPRRTSPDRVPSSTAPTVRRTVTTHQTSSPSVGVAQSSVEPSSTAPPQTGPVSTWKARNTPGGATGRSGERPRKRGAWSEEEDDRIIMLLKAHGRSWSKILTQDQLCPAVDGGPKLLEQRRTQIDIKDRARVLKLRYVKENPDALIPNHFLEMSLPSWVSKSYSDSIKLRERQQQLA